jgi:hypothetical protein
MRESIEALSAMLPDVTQQKGEVLGDFVLGVDSLDRALRLAGAAVDALFGVDHEVVAGVVDTVDRADLDATLVLRADTRLRNHVGHRVLLSEISRSGFIPVRPRPQHPPLTSIIAAHDQGHTAM